MGKYLALRIAAGTPVEFVYALETPVMAQNDPQAVTLLSPQSTVTADAGAISMKYNQGLMTVIDRLKAAIIALDGTI